MALFAQALRELGALLGAVRRSTLIAAADGSAERLAESSLRPMPMFDDPGFYKRAQIAASDLALAGWPNSTTSTA